MVGSSGDSLCSIGTRSVGTSEAAAGPSFESLASFPVAVRLLTP